MIAVGVESNCMHFNGREREGVNLWLVMGVHELFLANSHENASFTPVEKKTIFSLSVVCEIEQTDECNRHVH